MRATPEYNQRLATLKEQLPKYYGVVLISKNNKIDIEKVYNVVHKRVVSEEILGELEAEFIAH